MCTVLLPTHLAVHVYCTTTNTSSSPCVLYCYQHIQQPTCTVLLPTHLAAHVYCTATNTSSSPCVLYCYQHIQQPMCTYYMYTAKKNLKKIKNYMYPNCGIFVHTISTCDAHVIGVQDCIMQSIFIVLVSPFMKYLSGNLFIRCSVAQTELMVQLSSNRLHMITVLGASNELIKFTRCKLLVATKI